MRLLIVITVAMGSMAYAGDEEWNDEFIPLGKYGQFGIGVFDRLGQQPDDLDRGGFDGTLRVSPAWRVTNRFRPGGFIEVRTPSFDGFEVMIGPQVQIKTGAVWGVQLRAGIGGEADGQHIGVAGVQFGNFIFGGTVTARRYFDDARTELSFNFEVATAILLFPFIAAVR